MTDLGDADELPVFGKIGVEDVGNNSMGKEDEGAYGINGVEAAALDSDAKMEPDDFNEKCIELNDFVTMEMLDIEMTDLGDDVELPVFETIGLKDVSDNCMGNEDEGAYGINGVEGVALDSDVKMKPDDFNEKCIKLDDFVTMIMLDIEMTDLGDADELPVFGKIGVEDVGNNCMGNEDERAYGINGVEAAALDSGAKMEPHDLIGKHIELDVFLTIEMYDTKMTDLGDDVELPMFETIGLKDVSDNCMGNEEEGGYGINGVEAAALDSDAKMEPDDFNKKFIELGGFVTMEMFDVELTVLCHDVELLLFETTGLEDVTDRCIENEDEEAYGIITVEVALLNANREIEPDDFIEKCIELDDFVTMVMFDIEMADLGDNVELPMFETIGLKDVSDNCMGNEEEGGYGINGVEAAALDSDAKMEPDDFNKKFIELGGFVTMEMFDVELTVLCHDVELLLFETTGLEDVTDRCIENEDEEAYGIITVEVALLNANVEIEPDDFSGKCIELDEFCTMEKFDFERIDLGDNDDLPVFEIIELEDVTDRRIPNEDE